MLFEHLLLLLLALALGGLLWLVNKQAKQINQLQNADKRHEDELQSRAKRIINDANSEALRILEKARVDAEKNQANLDKKLDAVNEKELQEYKQTIQKVSKDIEDSSVRELMDGKKVVDAEINSIVKKAEEEVELYKQKKITEINNRMMSFVKELSLKVLSDSIQVDRQKDFILKSLEEAKEGHVF